MARYYTNITGVSQALLDFIGYYIVDEDEEFKILWHKGDIHFIDKNKPYLYLDDRTDAEVLKGLLAGRERIPMPPKNGSK